MDVAFPERLRLKSKKSLLKRSLLKRLRSESCQPLRSRRGRQVQKSFTAFYRDESGSVEAGLSFIPLTILFLVTTQLAFASQWGGARQASQQDLTNRIAITGSANGTTSREATDRVRYEPLVGGGYLVISERVEPIPLIANFAGVVPGELMYRKQVVSMSEVFTQ
jgi:hypothetical protein